MPGGRGRGRGGGGRGRGPRPRRIRRFLEPTVLLLLHQAPAHGYALVERMHGLGLEEYPTDMSAIYRVLYGLEERGHVASRQVSDGSAGPPRRVYALTSTGETYLAAWVADLRATDRLLHRFLRAYDAHQAEHRSNQ